MKVERVSYPLMTPSAARGVLEAIFWEPQMYYVIDGIRVVKRGHWASFRRNEVMAKVSVRNAQSWMKKPDSFSPIEAGGGARDGTQRNTLALEEVEYVVVAEVRLSELGRKRSLPLKKYRDEFERRARRGKCYHRPALGVREFAADFDWLEAPDAVELAHWPEDDLGLMLYDVFDHRERAEGFRWRSPEELAETAASRAAAIEQLPKRQQRAAAKEPLSQYEGTAIKPQAHFFHAMIQDARLDCHPDRVEIIAKNREEDAKCC